ncbi:hypothetical protein DICVIV_02838 [Dictyocaulus viviparus]|uniref:Uncharacterized protein n=1 Tax=Dictyocaulus viviparus TaxID=29172 RepID=A0A0D8Y2P8_DICVI|nr:hypothetical protein DICVIV_02838 [Dictyocaulus viviparus]
MASICRYDDWDNLTYKKPKRLSVPCARMESDGEWFQINRILDTVFVAGSNKGWQSLVQWKPSWSQDIHASLAVKDFYSKATVLGCVVKDSFLRSRIRRKIEWNRKEFMCMNFRVQIHRPDGSTMYEDIPYPDVKRRFPAALFEYFENKMHPHRVAKADESRKDGLLSIYNNVTDSVVMSRCIFANRELPKRKEIDIHTKTPILKEDHSTILGNVPKLPRMKCGKKRSCELLYGVESCSVVQKKPTFGNEWDLNSA